VSQELLHKAVQASMKDELPEFAVGDTVKVHVRIVEGEKERIQDFTGTVIARSGGGIAESITVRRIVNNEGVERIFPLHSPRVAGLDVVRRGHTRRAKLHYLRKRVGKATRVRDLKVDSKAGQAARAEAREKSAKVRAARQAKREAAAEKAAQTKQAPQAEQAETGEQNPES
jgi:large subunit ribosomal protein L19